MFVFQLGLLILSSFCINSHERKYSLEIIDWLNFLLLGEKCKQLQKSNYIETYNFIKI